MRRLLVLLLAFSLIAVAPRVLGGDSSGSAVVGNVAPEILSPHLDRARTDDFFTLNFNIRDNNTLNGLIARVVLWHAPAYLTSPNNATDHLSFVWSGGVWSEETLSGHLASSTAPANPINVALGQFKIPCWLNAPAAITTTEAPTGKPSAPKNRISPMRGAP